MQGILEIREFETRLRGDGTKLVFDVHLVKVILVFIDGSHGVDTLPLVFSKLLFRLQAKHVVLTCRVIICVS